MLQKLSIFYFIKQNILKVTVLTKKGRFESQMASVSWQRPISWLPEINEVVYLNLRLSEVTQYHNKWPNWKNFLSKWRVSEDFSLLVFFKLWGLECYKFGALNSIQVCPRILRKNCSIGSLAIYIYMYIIYMELLVLQAIKVFF